MGIPEEKVTLDAWVIEEEVVVKAGVIPEDGVILEDRTLQEEQMIPEGWGGGGGGCKTEGVIQEEGVIDPRKQGASRRVSESKKSGCFKKRG